MNKRETERVSYALVGDSVIGASESIAYLLHCSASEVLVYNAYETIAKTRLRNGCRDLQPGGYSAEGGLLPRLE